MRPHPLDFYVGIKRYFTDLKPPCRGRVLRPLGFRVFEILEGTEGSENLYLLYKLNVDTIHALRVISKRFGGKWKYAGLKDKEAQTVQFLSSNKALNAFVWERGSKVIVLKRVGRGVVRKKYLKGNYFVIDLEFECEVEDYAKEVEGLWEVPGIYGYQRFGSRRPVSHVIGKLALQGKWEEAVDVLLGEPFPWESEESRRVREEYYRLGPKAFLRAPKFMDLEREVASKLLEGKGPKEALLSLSVFKLFLQAYQSYLYNKLLSEGDACNGPRRLPGPGAEEYKLLLEEEGVSLEEFRKFGLKAWPREPCFKTKINVFAEGRIMRLAFALPKGYYATSVIREVLKGEPWSA